MNKRLPIESTLPIAAIPPPRLHITSRRSDYHIHMVKLPAHPDATPIILSVTAKFVHPRNEWIAWFTHDSLKNLGCGHADTEAGAITKLAFSHTFDPFFYTLSAARTLEEWEEERRPDWMPIFLWRFFGKHHRRRQKLERMFSDEAKRNWPIK